MASDDEREAQIRHLADVHKKNTTERERFLLRRINEARAEIAPPGASAMEEAETILDEVLAILFDGTKPRVYQREQAEAPIARAIEAAERRGATVRLASETATESALRRAAALLAVFEDGRVWVRGQDSIQDVANEITASERLAERRGREAMRDEAAKIARGNPINGGDWPYRQ